MVRCISIYYLPQLQMPTYINKGARYAINSNLAYVLGLPQQIIISPTNFCGSPSHHEEVPEIFYGEPSSIAAGTILAKSGLDHRSLFLLAG
jgi:hypothetical protein